MHLVEEPEALLVQGERRDTRIVTTRNLPTLLDAMCGPAAEERARLL
jgi:hypothetical protein